MDPTAELLVELETLPLVPARVLVNEPETSRYQRLVLDVSDHPIATSYSAPGQFVALAIEPATRRYFALASPPDHHGDRVELLIDRDGTVGSQLPELGPDAEIWASEARGAGYPMTRFRQRPLVILTTGSGVASVRPVIESLLQNGTTPDAYFYYGESTEGDWAYQPAMRAWAERGVHVRLVPGDARDGSPRFVQDAYLGDPDAPRPPNVEVILCGADAMEQAAERMLVRLGQPPERIHRNY